MAKKSFRGDRNFQLRIFLKTEKHVHNFKMNLPQLQSLRVLFKRSRSHLVTEIFPTPESSQMVCFGLKRKHVHRFLSKLLPWPGIDPKAVYLRETLARMKSL